MKRYLVFDYPRKSQGCENYLVGHLFHDGGREELLLFVFDTHTGKFICGFYSSK
jgi:hypothetical protein